jgi:hypothetical protein
MTTALEGGEVSASRPGRSLPPGKTRYPLYRRLGGPQGRFGQVRKTSSPPGFDPPPVQPVASRYTDYTTRPTYRLGTDESWFISRQGLNHFSPPSIHPEFLGSTSLPRNKCVGFFFGDQKWLSCDPNNSPKHCTELKNYSVNRVGLYGSISETNSVNSSKM